MTRYYISVKENHISWTNVISQLQEGLAAALTNQISEVSLLEME